MAEFIYTMKKARKAHGDKVILDDVTLMFLPGAKIGVVGPNGSGKSTVLQIMAGLQQPSNGEAFLSPGYTVGILLQEPSQVEIYIFPIVYNICIFRAKLLQSCWVALWLRNE